MSRQLTAAILLLVGLLGVPAPASAAEPLSKDEVDRFVLPLVEGEWVSGMVVGLIDEGGARVMGYGHASADDPSPPRGDSVFEIGSITKGFTGVLLADMVRRGEVALDDPVQRYLPQDARVPHVGERPITLLDLATHRSGLPRLPDNLAPRNVANLYADYGFEELYSYLSGCFPGRRPGESYEYSNLGVGLLGHALARRAGRRYETLVVERIATPLGMSDTRITLSDDLRRRLVPGHDLDGNVVPNWDVPALAGALAFRSTTDDLLKFVAANLGGPAPADLAADLKFGQVVRANASPEHDIGLCWLLDRRLGAVWHNGETGGYRAYLGFSPRRRVGVVVLASTPTPRVEFVGRQLLARLLGRPARPMRVRRAITLDPAVLESYVGRYRVGPLYALKVTREGNQLFCDAPDRPRFKLYPETPTAFFWKVADGGVTFTTDDAGEVTGLTLHQFGQDFPAIKLAD